jgi:ethanolamine permease
VIQPQQPTLKKAISALQLWAIGVGLVISGEYFGWNYGWGVAGTMGFLIATLIVTVLYICFIFSFTELTSAMPEAGGPFTYANKAFGPLGGLVAGYATLIEFLFAPPAVAFALGGYIHFLYPSFDILYTAIACFVLFSIINLLGIKESAVFTLVVTVLAIAELLVFLGITAPHFEMANFMQDNMTNGWSGIFAALPFAIWFYLAIEGVAMVSEEVKEPKKSIPIGYIAGILTLTFLALSVMFAAGGISDWKNLSAIDYPLPEAIGIVLGKQNGITKLFAGIGLFGLIASFHGIILAYSRQIFALARAGFLPVFLSKIHPRFLTPHWSLIAGGVVGIIAVCSGTTDKLIILSVLGAVVMYIISMISLFVLRIKEPLMDRPFMSPFYPWFPAIALVLSTICLVAIIWSNLILSIIFFASLLVIVIFFMVSGSHKKMLLERLSTQTPL